MYAQIILDLNNSDLDVILTKLLQKVDNSPSCVHRLHELMLQIYFFNGHQSVKCAPIIAIETVIVKSLTFHINTIEDVTHNIDSMDATYS